MPATNHMKTKYNLMLSTAGLSCGDETQKNGIRHRGVARLLRGFLCSSVFALSLATAGAECPQWDVGGHWAISQGRFKISVALSQNGTTVSGSAIHHNAMISKPSGQKFGQAADLNGSVTGTIEGGTFQVEINWDGGGAGIYRGTIGQNGVIRGTTYDKNKPSSTATWSSNRVMNCADATAVQPPNPTPKAIPSSGRKRTNPTPPPLKATDEASKPQILPSAGGPTITAHPTAVTIPAGQSQGTVTLTWDGGPDHPSAEVWRKEGTSGPETLVVQRGKGTRSVTVDRGKIYQFILRDAGQQLARAVVIAKR